MAVEVFDDEMMVPGVSLPWAETKPRWQADLPLILALVAAYGVSFFLIARSLLGISSPRDLTAGLVVLVLSVAFTALLYSPFGRIDFIISVDESGMWITHRGHRIFGRRVEFYSPSHLPANEIGEIKIAWGKGTAVSAGADPRHHKVGRTNHNINRYTTLAILVEQTRSGLKRPWWLYRCDQAHELATALTLARRAHRLRFNVRPNHPARQWGSETMPTTASLRRVLPDFDGERPLDVVLSDAVDRHRILHVGRFSDEEMAALRGGEIDPHPSRWLTTVEPDLQPQAVAEGRLSLMRDGRAEFAGETVTATAPHVQAMVWARTTFDGLGSVDIKGARHTRSGQHGRMDSRVLLYRSRPDLFLVEVIGPLGFHDVSFADTAAVSTWLVEMAKARAEIDEEIMFEANRPQQLTSRVGLLSRAAYRTTSLYMEDGSGPRHLEIFCMDNEVWLAEHLNLTEDSVELRLRQTGARQLKLHVANTIGPMQ